MSKRFFDVIASVAGIIVLAPLFIVIALAIRGSDGGPVFYSQERIGLAGRPFRIRKFRTMGVDADKIGPGITRQGDPRVTRPGRFLRKWKLDELPQLFNVVAGDMSFVGPRPEIPRYVELYTEAERRVLTMRPGITDLATLRFRDEEVLLAQATDPEQFYRSYCIPKKIEFNLEYAARASTLSDIKLIFQTLAAVIRFRN